MSISEQIANLKATNVSFKDRMSEIAKKSIDEGRSFDTAEAAEFDDLESKVKALDADIARLSRLEAIQGDSAKSVDAGKPSDSVKMNSSSDVSRVNVKNTQKLEPGIAFARYARVKAHAHAGSLGGLRNELDVAKALYPEDSELVNGIQKAAVSAANTGDPLWAGNLILDGGAAFADFVEYLRPRTLLGQVSGRFRRLPFDTPVLIQSTAGVGGWVSEGAAKPATSWSYTKTKLEPLKVAAIAVATQETLNRASVATDTLIRDELARSIGASLDTKLFSTDAAVADTSPAGLLNGVTPITTTGTTDPEDVKCDIKNFLNTFAGDNLTIQDAFWVMPETVAITLSLMTNAMGAPAFPGVTPTGGTLMGIPVVTSGYVDSDSSGSVVALVKGSDIYYGDEGGLRVAISREATIQMDTQPTQNSITPTATTGVSMFQTNSVAWLVERFVSWSKRRSQAVVYSRVQWDLC